VFDSLSKKLQKVFRDLRGLGRISETNISESLREVRMALLDADVNFKVARDFIERVKDKAIGQQVIQSIKPGEQVVKIIHDELVDLLGASNAALGTSRNPSCILMVGLHGSGKTTSSGKLAQTPGQAGAQGVARRRGRLSPGGHGPIGDARQADRNPRAGDARRNGCSQNRPGGHGSVPSDLRA
jgi:signal recognition particle GTPase